MYFIVVCGSVIVYFVVVYNGLDKQNTGTERNIVDLQIAGWYLSVHVSVGDEGLGSVI